MERKKRTAQDFSQRLREARRKAGLSQEALAERLNVSRQAVSKWESGGAAPSTEKLAELSQVLDTTVDALLGGQETSAPRQRQGERRGPLILAVLALAAALAVGAVAAVLAVRLRETESALLQVQGRLGTLETRLAELSLPQAPDRQEAEITAFSWEPVHYDAARKQVTVALRATPRTMAADASAQFILTGERGEPVSVQGEREPWGGFSAQAELPLTMGQIRVDLAVIDGETGGRRTETADYLGVLENAFSLDWDLRFEGQAQRQGDQVTLSGPAAVTYNFGICDDRTVLWPVSGSVTLTMAGKVLDQAKLDFSTQREQLAQEEEEAVLLTATAQAELSAQAKGGAPLELTAQITDNYGNLYEKKLVLLD